MTAHVQIKDDFVLSAILAKQRAAFLRDGPPSLARRKGDLQKLKSALLAQRGNFEKALDADFGGRSAFETRIMELISLVQGINYLKRNIKSWMRPERRQVAAHFLPGQAQVIYQPLGVVGILSPWNYPMALALLPLATALAAGNRVMLKPSELTPATTALLSRMLAEIFPDDQVAIATGGADVGATFASLPFDHLVFTGSTSVGQSVMKAAAGNLVPVTLELGGKSPVIIDRSASIELAAERVAYGKLANAGQTCIAPDYALVPEDSIADFAAAYEAAVARLYPGGVLDDNYTSIVNARHVNRLQSLADDARRKGARVLEIGGGDAGSTSRRLAPTLIFDVTDDMAVMKDEIFGPALPLVAYRNIDEAIDYVNRRPRPLALYYFGKRGESRNKVLARTTSGNVTINDTLLHYVQDALPFGGIGASGMGAYHGVEGFRSLSHAKGVFVQGRWNFTGMLRPPYSSRMTGLALRYLLR